MQSTREVTKAYRKLMNQVENDDFYQIDLTDRVNCYACPAGHITKTKDVDPGVTPFMHKCKKCGQLAVSSMYEDDHPEIDPVEEWYRPSLEETLKLRKHPAQLDHVLQGGLLVRDIVKNPCPIQGERCINEEFCRDKGFCIRCE